MLRWFKALQARRRDPAALLQDKLLRALHDGGAPENIRARLLADPALAEFHDYIMQLDPALLAVGQELSRKWSRLG